ncbi:glycosyltransferase [Frigoribacterium salinisoli]
MSSGPLRLALVSLHTSPGADPGSGDAGGMNVVVRHQAAALGALGHDVEVLTRRSSPDQPAVSELAPGVVLRVLDAGPAEVVPKGRHEEFTAEFTATMRELGPWDVVHGHHWFSGVAALPVARDLGVPYLQSYHSIAADPSTPLSHGERPESAGRLAGEARLAREADVVVAVSEAEAATVSERLRGAAERVVVVPPGVDADVFRPGPRDSPPFVLVAGRLEPLKGPDLALRAVAAVPAGVRPRLVVAGGASSEHADYEAELHRLADELGLADEVTFVGPRSRRGLAELLRGASVVVVPSHSETYGLVALEAAASGTPVVAADAGGLREAVVHGATGTIVGDRDPETWGAAIGAYLDDADLAAVTATAAREHALARPWSRSARALEATYRRALSAR